MPELAEATTGRETPASAAQRNPRRRSPQRWDVSQWWIAALLAGPTIALMLLGYHRRWISDDGLIYTRSVREILAGNGPVLSPGQRAETAPARCGSGCSCF